MLSDTLQGIPLFPRPLDAYPHVDGGLAAILASRVHAEPFNAIATAIFALAILHTFLATRFTRLAHRVEARHEDAMRRDGRMPTPSVAAEALHFLGEVEVVFGLWAVVLLAAITVFEGWETAAHYVNGTVSYTEPLFVVVIMALASTRPVVGFAEGALRRIAGARGDSPAAWWLTILMLGPLLGSFITEPAAMTICALLLARQFYDRRPSNRLKYATLGLLFVNVSIGGTLTPFAAPPILMVARPWGWTGTFMIAHIGWRAVLAMIASTSVYYATFRRDLRSLARTPVRIDVDEPDDDAIGETLLPVPSWVVAVHLGFMAWTVATAHYPALFIGGFLFFLGFVRATGAYQSRVELKTPLLVGFFLAGLVIHGGLQAWWIGPVLRGLPATPLFIGSTLLTAFNDNALITYLATLVPNLADTLKFAVVEGAVVGGGLTVIANAPNPAGQALLGRFFEDGVSPLGLFLGAVPPTVITAVIFWIL